MRLRIAPDTGAWKCAVPTHVSCSFMALRVIHKPFTLYFEWAHIVPVYILVIIRPPPLQQTVHNTLRVLVLQLRTFYLHSLPTHGARFTSGARFTFWCFSYNALSSFVHAEPLSCYLELVIICQPPPQLSITTWARFHLARKNFKA
jgi:hypothetical protein